MASRLIRRMLKSKIHHAVVTGADIDYEGSLTIDGALMNAADILEYEEVRVWNVTRGTRLTTYAMRGAAESGVMCINGAAAHLVHPGDTIIVATFADLDDAEARRLRPTIVLVGPDNRLKRRVATEAAGPQRRAD